MNGDKHVKIQLFAKLKKQLILGRVQRHLKIQGDCEPFIQDLFKILPNLYVNVYITINHRVAFNYKHLS